MSLPFYFSTTFIPGTACIGDSRVFINNNFNTLLSAVSTLWTGVPILSSNGISVLDNPLAIEVNSTVPALRIKQEGIGDTIRVFNPNNPLSTPFVVNSGGQIIVGSLSAFNVVTGLQLVSDSPGGFNLPPNSDILLRLNTNTPNAADLIFEKARGTQAQMSAVSADDFLGSLIFYGYNGTRMVSAASIAVKVEGAPNLSATPGSLVFSTRLSSVNAVETTERMRISHDGKVGIGTSIPTTTLDVSGTIKAISLTSTNISAANIRVNTINTNIFNVTNTVTTSGFNTSNFNAANGLVTNLTAINFITYNPIQYSTVSALLISGDANFTAGAIISSGTNLLDLFIKQVYFPTLTSTYTAVYPNSANWNTAYTVVCSNSANWNTAYTVVCSNSANWNTAYTVVCSNSANWNTAYTVVCSNSAYWNAGGQLNFATLNNYLSTNNIILSTAQITNNLSVTGNILATGSLSARNIFLSGGSVITSSSTLETPTTGISAVNNIIALSQSTYNTLTVKRPNTFYIIVG